MGAWDNNLQGNDTAMDAIGNIADMLGVPEQIEHSKNLDWALMPNYRMNDKQVRVALLIGMGCDRGTQDEEWGLLGVADWLIEKGYTINPQYVGEIHLALHRAYQRANLWREPKERLDSLMEFEDRLNANQRKA
jgi:hypothetical protein